MEALYGKQGRGTQFRTRTERDAFLQKQIDTLTLQVIFHIDSLCK